ncbi:unnamed protein product [Porites lobata]|uniref:EF-hand domain-containing protein n=1 Tax=Porites lobata TaxID=104759 RepID=A0ABN8RB77_9CNID|nr:unnamed protein product [Porites lobata]
MEDSQEKDCSFLGNDTFPNLYDALVYERKFKSEYLERQIYERSPKSEPSIVKLIEKLSEPSIVKFIENQSEHLSKFVFKKISMIDIPKSSKLHRYVNKIFDEADLDDDSQLSFAEFEHVISKAPDFVK